MKKKQSDTREIGGMESFNRVKAAAYVGMSLATFDRILALSRIGKAKVALKFYQVKKGAPIWFPREFLDGFVLEVMNKGCAV